MSFTRRKSWAPRIHFAALPRPDHKTGKITYAYKPLSISELRGPEYGKIAQRRVQTRDERGDELALNWWFGWREDNPEGELPVWKPVEWSERPHPGNRVPFLLHEQLVSPTTIIAPPGIPGPSLAPTVGKLTPDEADLGTECSTPSTVPTTTVQCKSLLCCIVQ